MILESFKIVHLVHFLFRSGGICVWVSLSVCLFVWSEDLRQRGKKEEREEKAEKRKQQKPWLGHREGDWWWLRGFFMCSCVFYVCVGVYDVCLELCVGLVLFFCLLFLLVCFFCFFPSFFRNEWVS